jgi:hypothetical protein
MALGVAATRRHLKTEPKRTVKGFPEDVQALNLITVF